MSDWEACSAVVDVCDSVVIFLLSKEWLDLNDRQATAFATTLNQLLLRAVSEPDSREKDKKQRRQVSTISVMAFSNSILVVDSTVSDLRCWHSGMDINMEFTIVALSSNSFFRVDFSRYLWKLSLFFERCWTVFPLLTFELKPWIRMQRWCYEVSNLTAT